MAVIVKGSGGSASAKYGTYILETESGDTARLVYVEEEEILLTAKAENIEKGYTAITEDGVVEGTYEYVAPEPEEPTSYEQLINYTMLYDEGNECSDVTGGWTLRSSGGSVKCTKNTNSMQLTRTGTGGAVAVTNNTIDTSDYKMLFTVANRYGADGSDGSAVMFHSSGDKVVAYPNDVDTSVVYKFDEINETKTRLVTIPSIHLGYMYCYFGGDSDATVYNIAIIKEDDWSTLADKAGVSATSLEALLADTSALTTIFNSEDAVNFMVAQCTGDFMVGVLNSESAVALLKNSPYLNTVVGNPHWAKFMMMIPTAKELLGVLLLYDEGDTCTDVTGGLTQAAETIGDNSGTVTFNTNSVHLAVTGSGYKDDARIRTSSLIALDGTYNKMWGKYINMAITGDNSTSTGTALYMSVGTTTTAFTDTIKSIQLVYSLSDKSRYIQNLDISAVSGNYYLSLGIGRGRDATGTGDADLTNAWLTKSDNWQTWASLGGITATDMASLLADSAKMATLMSNEEAVKYLRGCTGDLMIAICNSETAMQAVVNNIAYDYLFDHPVWYKFMTMCPVSLAAMDSVAVTVPTMTSNTAPSGECFADSTSNSTSYPYYKAFDGDGTTWWESGKSMSTLGAYIGYDLGYLADIYKWSASLSSGTTGNLTVSLQSSDDGSTWVDLKSFTITDYGGNDTMDTSYGTYEFVFDAPIRARAMRVITTAYASYSQDNRLKQRLGNFYGKAVAEYDTSVSSRSIGINLQSLTSDATATPEDITYGKTAYVNGVKIIGTRISS